MAEPWLIMDLSCNDISHGQLPFMTSDMIQKAIIMDDFP